MAVAESLLTRAESQCELCASSVNLDTFTVPPKNSEEDADQIVVCPTCLEQIQAMDNLDANHWRCLNQSMWSQVPAVQVMVYRLLQNLSATDWAQDLLGMLFLEESTLEWAQATADEKVVHKDSNGNVLQAGDSVTLIQDLNVKGANFTAKRGTAVRRIRLVPDNAEQIEGKVEGQQIVILTKYVKRI